MKLKHCAAFLFVLISCSFYAQKDSLHVVAWNVFLRPGVLKDNQLGRVHAISNYLNETNADVLVLQEVFHHKSRRILKKELKSNYPYRTAVGKGSWLGISSGVIIFSKHPITNEKHIYFNRAIHADRMAKKGGVLAEIELNHRSVNVVGTHLQAGQGDMEVEIRKEQIQMLKKLSANSPKETIYAGDFNIRRQSDSYKDLVKTLECENKEPTGKHEHTSNFSDHKLMQANGLPQWIDFILTKISPGVHIEESYIEEPRVQKGDTQERISDHNPIHSFIYFE